MALLFKAHIAGHIKWGNMFYRDNWFTWQHDNGPLYGPKLSKEAEFKCAIKNVITRPVKSYYEELLENARIIRDTFPGELDLLFSGGIDSEVILRIYLDLKIPINVYVFKYANDHNIHDYTHAIKTCRSLNVTPKVIDLDLEKFFENEAYDILQKCHATGPGWLPHMKMTEYTDGTPIIGSGEAYYRRTSRDMNQKYSWVFELDEAPHHWAVYHKTIGRTAITDWYEYSPELIVAYTKLPYVQKLLNDDVDGKLDNVSSKSIIHQEYWPDLSNRMKLVGFEGITPNKEKLFPPFMIEFGKAHIWTPYKAPVKQTWSVDDVLRTLGDQ